MGEHQLFFLFFQKHCANSGEGMLAGAGCIAGGCTSAKPRWSEVMIILCDFLRQGSPSQEEKNATIFQVILYSSWFSIVKYINERMQNNNRSE